MSLDMNTFRNSPPVSRTFAACVFVVSMLSVCRVFTGYRLMFAWPFILRKFPEVWRFFTSFMLTGGFNIILTPYSIWNFGGALERDCTRLRSASFVVYLFFVGFVNLVVNNYIWHSSFFLNAMMLSIIWTYAQNNRGAITNIMGINIPVQYLPAASLFLALIMAGPESAMEEATGIFSAHLWEFLTHYWPRFGGGVDLIPTPRFLVNYFHPNEERSRQIKSFGRSTRPTLGLGEAANSAFTTGNAWGQRGMGRRLGGE